MEYNPELFSKMVQANRDAQTERSHALNHISDLCEQGQRDKVLPYLIPAMQANPPLKKIKLWQLDAAMYGTTRARALRWIRKMRVLIHDQSHVKDGFATVEWALHDRENSVRMVTWLWLLMEREHATEFTPPAGFPYRQIFEADS